MPYIIEHPSLNSEQTNINDNQQRSKFGADVVCDQTDRVFFCCRINRCHSLQPVTRQNSANIARPMCDVTSADWIEHWGYVVQLTENWQTLPVKLLGHAHVKVLLPSTHVALLLQGLPSHSSMSVSHLQNTSDVIRLFIRSTIAIQSLRSNNIQSCM